jgi:hypothetical protein
MSNITTVDICYARISTNDKKQRSSLINQCDALRKLRGDNTVLIQKVHCGENDFPEELTNKILEEKQKGNEVRLNVFAFDRLTRNLRDVDFVYKNVKCLYVIGKNTECCREYDVKNELKEITINILGAIEWSLENKKRGITHANYRKITDQKRPRSEETEREHEQILDMRKQCLLISNNLKNNGVPDKVITTMEEFIRLSQNLDSIAKWNKMFSLAKNLGLDINEMKRNYNECLKEYKNKKDAHIQDKQ